MLKTFFLWWLTLLWVLVGGCTSTPDQSSSQNRLANLANVITNGFIRQKSFAYFSSKDSCFFVNYYQSQDYWREMGHSFDRMKTPNANYQYFHHYYPIGYDFTLVSFDRQPDSLYFYGLNDFQFLRRYALANHEWIVDSTSMRMMDRAKDPEFRLIDLSQEGNVAFLNTTLLPAAGFTPRGLYDESQIYDRLYALAALVYNLYREPGYAYNSFLRDIGGSYALKMRLKELKAEAFPNDTLSDAEVQLIDSLTNLRGPDREPPYTDTYFYEATNGVFVFTCLRIGIMK
ncbi:hypothetical protein SAMN05421823_12318 [Catalinimonas alkaloidigena]|uniref:Lipoprotein n=1 Tax=Catalinimonas alkaloidigena TaxID=1075417 RepID=A0A1G9VS50_9BACT|nr:hypothetical protein [Catalinimonas alkaloidigena]SDM75092.1 hypothetical protein SAMN05421823_12318 [Catalinimonas alkaloidigena]